MPTESEFRSAASKIRTEKEELAGLAARVPRMSANPDPYSFLTVGQSSLAAALQSSFSQIRSDHRRAAFELEELAKLCDERAEVCEDHRLAVMWWKRDRAAHEAAARRYYLGGGTGSYPPFTDPYPETEPWVELE